MQIFEFDCIVVGSGCAAFNAADTLFNEGIKHMAILTEGVRMGTSRNTGSDKQTYYKMSLNGLDMDSPEYMAKTLKVAGVDGDIALCEAAGSLESFFKLIQLGVPFPRNEYGEFVGYKTDHDPLQRATSVGPLTSKFMVEALEKSVRDKNIFMEDMICVSKILVVDKKVIGLVGYHKLKKEFQVYKSPNIILCTGGPSNVYENTVYPGSQTGMSSLALECGALASNLNEWQYGIASTKFKWNLSGSYMQVLPKFISVDTDGNEYEFLTDQLGEEALNLTFLKGYQWPFDYAKVLGSSKVDTLVNEEVALKNRRVFLDYRYNPSCLQEHCKNLFIEGYSYLESCNALQERPIDRLRAMNEPAYQLYKQHGIDFDLERVEIKVCAQHHNGGVLVDANWQSTIEGLFVAGEAAGTFGVTRPGGSALNSTQVGSARAARFIASKKDSQKEDANITSLVKLAEEYVNSLLEVSDNHLLEVFKSMQHRMSSYAGIIRNLKQMEQMKDELNILLSRVKSVNSKNIVQGLKIWDTFYVQRAVLSAMIYAGEHIGSRGSCYYEDSTVSRSVNDKIITQTIPEVSSYLLPCNEIPVREESFETVWAKNR